MNQLIFSKLYSGYGYVGAQVDRVMDKVSPALTMYPQ